jgi:ankyrin repeat protein
MEPIFEAVLKGESEVVRLLRDRPAAIGARMSRDLLVRAIPHALYEGDTSLHLAAAGLQTAVAALLLERGADPNAENRRGATPLHYACDARPRAGGVWQPEEQSALIRLLAGHAAELDRGDRGGATPLHRAVRARSVAAVRQLLALGARCDSRLAQRGSTPLHLAVRSTGASGTAATLGEQLEIVALLRAHGADPDAADASGRTPRVGATSAAVRDALEGGGRRRGLARSAEPRIVPKKTSRRKRD